jgi:HTH-type transcriptional regulator / antitoxin HigA
MDIRPIRTDEDHANTLKIIDSLWGAEAGTPEGDKLEVLIILADSYESTRWPSEPSDPVDTIKAHMEATERGQSDLAKLIGSRSRASEVMARKRPLTINMVRNLASDWHLPVSLLIAPYDLKKSTSRKSRKPLRRSRTKGAAAA